MGKTKAVVHRSAKAFWHSKEIYFLFSGAICLGLAVIYAINYGITNPSNGYASTCADSLVPAYSYPNPPTFWNTMTDSKPPVAYLIANDDNGPGTSVDSNYTTVINNAEGAGITVLGYVYTNYGSRSISDVEADIDGWKSLYGVTSIAIDEVSSAANEESYYQTLADYIRTNDGAVFLNPGTIPDQGYMNIGDVVSIFEGSESDFQSFSPPSWSSQYPSSKLAAVVYDVTGGSSDMQTILNKLSSDGIGNIYITDENTPNPYSTVPSFWSSEVSDMNALCNSSGGGGSSGGSGGSSGGSSSGSSGSKSGGSSGGSKSGTDSSSQPKSSSPTTTSTSSGSDKSATGSKTDTGQDSQSTQTKGGAAEKASTKPKSNRQTIAIISAVGTFIAITLAGLGIIKWTIL